MNSKLDLAIPDVNVLNLARYRPQAEITSRMKHHVTITKVATMPHKVNTMVAEAGLHLKFVTFCEFQKLRQRRAHFEFF